MRIVAWRMGFAGDVLFSTAALEGIKQKYPRAQLTYGVWPQYASLIASNPYIDQFVYDDPTLERAKKRGHQSWEISHEKYKLPPGEMEYWGKIHARQAADLRLLNLETMHSFKPQIFLDAADIVPKPAGTKVAALGVFSKNGADARLWGMRRGKWPKPGLSGPAMAMLYGRALAHIGDKWEFYPDHWPKLVTELNKMGFQCIQLGGKTDPRVPGAHDLCGKLSWRQSVGAVMQADVCITIDSFLLHAAVARKYDLDGSVLSEGTPVVALLGPTDGRAMFPQDAEQVMEVQARQYSACPCFNSARFGQGPCQYGNACMTDITVEQILEGVEKCPTNANFVRK